MKFTGLTRKAFSLLVAISMLMTMFDIGLLAHATGADAGNDVVMEIQGDAESTEVPTEEPIQALEEVGDVDNGEDGDDVDADSVAPVTAEAASADELEQALTDGADEIAITGDFELDRTFYVTKDTYIYTDSTRTLTRNVDFGGDVFVVGEAADGTACGDTVTLTIGSLDVEYGNLLTIDGNKECMATDVTGTVIFVCNDAHVNVHNITFTNCEKSGNERTEDEKYGLSYTNRIGGPAIILASGSMDIYGGTFSNNAVNDEDDSDEETMNSTQGGAIYSFGELNIYGTVFENNYAARGGALYNYRTTNIYNAKFTGNTASFRGGAVYMANSTLCYLYLGGENEVVESKVVFENNTSVNNGGAVFAQGVFDVKNTEFKSNSSTQGHGGAVVSSGKITDNKTMTVADSVFSGNTAYYNGGAVYMNSGSESYYTNVDFIENTAYATANSSGTRYGGGALYSTGSTFEINGAEFTSNVSGYNGGAVALYSEATALMNDITASGNKAEESAGGFLYNVNSVLNMYNSSLSQNEAATHGGAMSYTGASVSNVYNTTFTENSAGTNGGALYVYPDATENILHTCTFTGNTSANYGGVLYASKACTLNMYNTVAENNTAKNGGFIYETTTGTNITLNGCTVSGNTATAGGPIIWGNSTGAKLYINKSNYTDKDVTGELGSDYWSSAIVNKLTVYDVASTVPGYTDYGQTEEPDDGSGDGSDDDSVSIISVTTSAELESAIKAGYSKIRINGDFELDRTFYITQNTQIYSDTAHVLTRATGFAGDIFVVGESSKGAACEETVVFTLGNPESDTEDLLTIDGNKANMTVDVTGTVIFVCNNAQADVYDNITVTNCEKSGNVKTSDESYGLSYTNRIGGPVAILASGTMNIYGGKYTNNAVNDEDDSSEDTMNSTQGGAIYSFGELNIYGGTFENNYAARGGALYNYRTTHIYNAKFTGNTASFRGGAVYMANSTLCYLYLGGENEKAESKVVFENNTSVENGGAIYAQAVLNVQDTEFKNNSTTAGNGGAVAASGHITSEETVTVTDSVFSGNTAANNGGAIYQNNESTTYFNNVDFTANTAYAGTNYGGGAMYITGSTAEFNGVDFTDNVSNYNAGAVATYSNSSITGKNVTFSGNSAEKGGGAIYSSKGTYKLYSATFSENTSGTKGGAIYLNTTSSFEADSAIFTANTAGGNGGAVMLEGESTALVNDVNASANKSSGSGGFLCNTGSTLNMYNSSLSENEATVHGGAMSYTGESVSNVYNTTFSKNSAGTNGGALYVYPDATENILHSCTFTGNTSSNYGGVLYASKACTLNMYNTVAENNTAKNGGFIYETTTGTKITLNGCTVSGNTATSGGPIIWGNSNGATLYINKSNYTDKDVTGELGSDYWSSAIVNKLTVEEISSEIPKYLDYGNETYDEYTDVHDVKTAAELEKAINDGVKNIRIVDSFEIDRTFYITADTVIFTTAKKTLKRAADFAGDIFVVGEDAEGNSSITSGTTAKLTLGNQYSEQSDLLIIDGNSENMTVDVTGTALFLAGSGQLDLHKNVSIINNRKVGNKKILDEKYVINNANRVGGAAIIVSDGTVNVYGATFRNNICNEENTAEGADESERDSSLGGAVYNRGTFNIHSGIFEGNTAARGGVIYNIRDIRLYSGQFIENHATSHGGAIYLAGSQYSQIYAGDVNSTQASETILFKNNYADSNGGAIYCATMAIAVIYGDTTFDGNKTPSGSGAAICSYGMINASNTTFKNNDAYSRGGAVYISNSSELNTTRIVSLADSRFENNIATYGGAVAIFAADESFSEGGIAEIENCEFVANKAVNQTEKEKTSNVFGGAIYNARKGSLTVTGSNFEENEALFEGGAIYSSGESTTTVTDSAFTKNKTAHETDAKGGAVSVHSATLDFDNVSFTENTTCKNGGAIYVSYTTAATVNSNVKVNNSSFTKNTAGTNGGAIYATKHEVETEEDSILTVKNSSFDENSTASKGGAVYLTSYADAYMKDVTFTKNTVASADTNTYGGAMYATASAEIEIDGASFTDNTASYCAGAIALADAARAVFNNITATGNSANTSAGFLYINSAKADIYESEIKNNTAGVNGGAFALYNLAVTNVNNTTFDGNSAGGNGGAIYDTTEETETLLHTCTFTNNKSSNFGGAIFANNTAILSGYNLTATGNSAFRGGVLYETTTDTTVTLNGLTVTGNTASDAGPIIYGNTTKAILNLHKLNYTDTERNDTADDAYWDYAIVNKLTVNDISDTEEEIPECDVYESKADEDDTETEKPVVPVTDVLNLGLKSSDDSINGVYNKLPKLDNSSNFMSRSTTVFENINGGDVTVDTFVSHQDETANNSNVGEGLLIYQAILYKQAHPDEEVNISIASFRFSSLAAVNINRNSRYFGYMRNLPKQNYDKYGFVRISYLLVTAAKMGINVTAIGQLDGYPHPATEPTFDEYMESFMDYPCDPTYVADGKVKDYLNFQRCDWTSYDDKAATDMMHLKMCAVSHYLDMNGVTHRNAVWSSSSNLDGINSKATNGNNKIQTGTIISDHEQIYRCAYNYMELVSQYCGQEDVYIFRQIAGERSENQTDLIEAGKADEIPANEQIVYLGTENDDVFELYFTPFGGDVMNWTEVYNPYCKYLRKFSNSDDYVTLIWNNANYSRTTPIVLQMEELINNTFVNKKDSRNEIYVNLADYDTSVYDEMVVGEDIGYMSFNEYHLGALHNKDLQLSYSENGKREYVSILNSINMHGGAMSYQSNFALVIKEDDCDEDSVFFNIADQTTVGMVEHTYGEEQTYLPESVYEDGYVYKACLNCDKKIISGVVHRPSEWTTAKEATAEANGILYQNCTACGTLLAAKEIVGKETEIEVTEGKTFSASASSSISVDGSTVPLTFEALVNVPKDINDRAGVIAGNYEIGNKDSISFEIYSDGRPRLFYRNGTESGDCTFDTDIRSDKAEHLALTIDGETATLYVNGEAVETKTLTVPLPPAADNMKIGGDNRKGNTRYFKGRIYSVALFSDVREAAEVKNDSVIVSSNADSLIYLEQLGEVATDSNTGSENAGVGIIFTPEGETFTSEKTHVIGNISSTPHTFEAIVNVPETQTERGGVVVSNYSNGTKAQVSIEIYTNGQPRLFFSTGTEKIDCLFDTDIRSDAPRHLAITVDGTVATLYVDGVEAETKTLSRTLPDGIADNFKIGGDDRSANAQYFKGTIYSVSMFSDVRTAQEVAKDAIMVTSDEDDLLYTGYYTTENDMPAFVAVEGREFTATESKDMYELSTAPLTFDAVVNVPTSVEDRAGVIVGNYRIGNVDSISFEIYSGGRPRLFYRKGTEAGDCTFDTDIRSNESVHLSLTLDGNTATLYVNGEATETKELTVPLPELTKEFKIGGDNRNGNGQYFKGTIYSVALFGDVRTEEEIKQGNVIGNADDILYSTYFTNIYGSTAVESSNGKVFTKDTSTLIPVNVDSSIYTFEAVINLSKNVETRAGVIIGNYKENINDVVNVEIYTGGKVRLFNRTESGTVDCMFDTDIRSNNKQHIAITVDDTLATLYVNGEVAETKTLEAPLQYSADNFKIGGDNRSGNAQYFKGTIYAVSLFGDVRTAEEIKADAAGVYDGEDALIFNTNYVSGVCPQNPTGGDHIESGWIIDKESVDGAKGLKHKECTICGTTLAVNEFMGVRAEGITVDYTTIKGLTPESEADAYTVDKAFETAPKTFEATFLLDKTYNDRAGVLIGNYNNTTDEQINVEVYTAGKPRLYYKTNNTAYTYTFKTDVRSDSITHLAITVDGLTATLYLNGEAKETVTLSTEPANACSGYMVGADHRETNPQYFKGTIYSAAMFNDARTAEEVKLDMLMIPGDADGLLFSHYFVD